MSLQMSLFMETAGIEPAPKSPRVAVPNLPCLQGIPGVRKLPVNQCGVPTYTTLVDEDVYEWASQRTWHIEFGYKGGVYVRGQWDGRQEFLHRAILGLPAGSPLLADHINGNTFDNRRANLRVVTNAQNAQNQGARRRSTSKHRGVGWCNTRKKWIAQGTLNGRNHNLGRYDTEEEAAKAAAAWRAEHIPFSQEARAA